MNPKDSPKPIFDIYRSHLISFYCKRYMLVIILSRFSLKKYIDTLREKSRLLTLANEIRRL